MIPSIGIMIAAYIVFRCVEVMCRNGSQFAGKTSRALTVIVASVAMIVAGLAGMDLLLAGSSHTLTTPQSLMRP